jgi:Capsule polysaccharide biosynthesis protein
MLDLRWDKGKRLVRRCLQSVGVLGFATRARQLMSASGRKQLSDDQENIAHLEKALDAQYSNLGAREGAVFLVYGAHTVRNIVAHVPLIMAAQRLGFRLHVLLPGANDLVVRGYKLCGVKDFINLADEMIVGPHRLTAHAQSSLTTTADLKNFIYKNCRVGKFCLSTLMRWSRLGDPDISDPATAAMLRVQLDRSLHAADAAERIITRLKPQIVLMNERSYSPYGEIFDAVLHHGGQCIVWTAGHRNDMLILKRYHRDNVEENHFSLSKKSWEQIKKLPWSERDWQQVRNEIVQSYQSGEWFSECATQLDKTSIERAALMERLGLDPNRKTVCVFPHMFWDATFFWGTDLFDNYEHWFTEVLKVARENKKTNWVVKIHPANVAKAIRDGYKGEHSELVAIRNTLGELPGHIKIIPPESDISTLSLLEVIDYCLTVRGTIGIEAGCFGIRVLTAGTGRYDGRGFTKDFSSRDEYREALRRLPELAQMSAPEIELARRFAYGTFMRRPTPLRSTTLRFRRNIGAQLEARIVSDGATLLEAPDVQRIAEWIASGEDDYLTPNETPGLVTGMLKGDLDVRA